MQAPKENIILVEHTVLFFQNTRDPCSSTDALCDFINLVSEPVGSRECRQPKASFTHQTIKQTQHVICVLNDNIYEKYNTQCLKIILAFCVFQSLFYKNGFIALTIIQTITDRTTYIHSELVK